jgi:hypothetical protein
MCYMEENICEERELLCHVHVSGLATGLASPY